MKVHKNILNSNYGMGGSAWVRLGYLRLMLALLVAAGHATWFQTSRTALLEIPALFGGTAAVVSFLVVSGFSITASLERNRTGFYWRRAVRIYPVYLLALASATALEIICHGHFIAPNRTLEALGWPTLIGNLIFLQTFVVKPVGFDGPLWSLGVEVFFYAMAPLVFLMKRQHLIMLMAVSAICFLIPKRADIGIAYLILSKTNAVNYAWPWLLGVILWQDRDKLVRSNAGLLATLGAGAALVQFGPLTHGSFGAVTFALTTACIWPRQHHLIGPRLSARSGFAGDLSYAVYLLHLPLLIALGTIGFADKPFIFLTCLIICSSLAIIYWEPQVRRIMQAIHDRSRWLPRHGRADHRNTAAGRINP